MKRIRLYDPGDAESPLCREWLCGKTRVFEYGSAPPPKAKRN